MTAVSGEAVFERIERMHQLISEVEPILQSLVMNDSTIIDGLAQMLGTLQHMHNRTEEHIAGLSKDVGELTAALARLGESSSVQPAQAQELDRKDPEIGLLAHLLPFLPNPVALDVGANVGSLARSLVEAGYEVFAFEPFAPSFAALGREVEQAASGLHPFPYAIGAEDGPAELLVAADTSGGGGKWDTSLFHSTVQHPMLEDLTFSSAVPVQMRSLASLARSGAIPAEAAVLKIDTEGADLEVIKGAGKMPFAVVVTEFWDRGHPFGRAGHGDIAAIARELRTRGYRWHIVLYRVDERGELGFYCNARNSVAKSWGNCVHFRDFDLFRRAVGWCDRVFSAGKNAQR
jgi:FkbM family methyltransferase